MKTLISLIILAAILTIASPAQSWHMGRQHHVPSIYEFTEEQRREQGRQLQERMYQLHEDRRRRENLRQQRELNRQLRILNQNLKRR